jgi:hypothetical protein
VPHARVPVSEGGAVQWNWGFRQKVDHNQLNYI